MRLKCAFVQLQLYKYQFMKNDSDKSDSFVVPARLENIKHVAIVANAHFLLSLSCSRLYKISCNTMLSILTDSGVCFNVIRNRLLA